MVRSDDNRTEKFTQSRPPKFEEKLQLRLARDIEFKRLLASNEALNARCSKLDEELYQVKVELYQVKARREFLEAYVRDLQKDLENWTGGQD